MKHERSLRVLALSLLLAACGGAETSSGEAAPAGGAESRAVAANLPSAADRDYAALTTSWAEAALEGCGRVLQEALGTRDLVQGALDGVHDERGRATAELEDANHWMGQGLAKLEEVRPRLEAGECDGNVTLALDEAVQFFVKAGTSAVQAGQIAAS